MSWMQTFTGEHFDFDLFVPESIKIPDLAHSLSNLCRFNGHCDCFYSVAQHSVLVSERCRPPDALWGLLHDTPEVYLGDRTRPLKEWLRLNCPAFLQLESRIEATIATRFGLIGRDPNDFIETRMHVKHWDAVLLATEARDLISAPRHDWGPLPEPLPMRIDPWVPEHAERRFLQRLRRLLRERRAAA
jgi:hypothetical protein